MKKNLINMIETRGAHIALQMFEDCRFFINIIFLEVLTLVGLTIGNEIVKGFAGFLLVGYFIAYRGIQNVIRYYLLTDEEYEYLYEHRNEVDE